MSATRMAAGRVARDLDVAVADLPGGRALEPEGDAGPELGGVEDDGLDGQVRVEDLREGPGATLVGEEGLGVDLGQRHDQVAPPRRHLRRPASQLVEAARDQVDVAQLAVEDAEEVLEALAADQRERVAGAGEGAAGDGRQRTQRRQAAEVLEVVEGAQVEGGGPEASTRQGQADRAEHRAGGRLGGIGRAHGPPTLALPVPVGTRGAGGLRRRRPPSWRPAAAPRRPWPCRPRRSSAGARTSAPASARTAPRRSWSGRRRPCRRSRPGR